MADTNQTNEFIKKHNFHPQCNELKTRFPRCFKNLLSETYINIHYDYDFTCRRVFEIFNNCVNVCSAHDKIKCCFFIYLQINYITFIIYTFCVYNIHIMNYSNYLCSVV